jgi:uncharacterized RDD family membrane protein YckC
VKTPSPLRKRDKKQRNLVTPEGIGVPIQLASRGSRMGALMLDTMILLFGVYLIFLVLDSLRGGVFDGMVADGEGAGGSGAYEFITIISILVAFFARYGYFLTLELGPRGATWGKRLVGIRVAAREGGRLTPEAVIARNLLRDIELTFPAVFLIVAFFMAIAGEFDIAWFWAALIWFSLFMLFPFFNKDNLRAGDIIAGTWVVEAPRTKLAETMSTSGAAAASGSSSVTGARYEFGETELSVYGEHELQVLERVLRDGKHEALGPVHAAICRKIGWDPGAGDERAFLEAFYAQLRAKLEGDMRFGKRKADKNS